MDLVFASAVSLPRLEDQVLGSGGNPVYSQEAVPDYLTNGQSFNISLCSILFRKPRILGQHFSGNPLQQLPHLVKPSEERSPPILLQLSAALILRFKSKN
jgi:hypothetical protein